MSHLLIKFRLYFSMMSLSLLVGGVWKQCSQDYLVGENDVREAMPPRGCVGNTCSDDAAGGILGPTTPPTLYL